MNDSYHHGRLREAILAAAAQSINADGPSHLSLRALAREVGVTHTAPRHHFGDKRGVLTALAVQGFGQMSAELRAAARSGSFADVGAAYVSYAREHPAHFTVMFQPDLTDPLNGELLAAKSDLMAVLRAGISELEQRGDVSDPDAAALASWSLAHGLATLAITGNLEESRISSLLAADDLEDLTRRALTMLHSSPA